MKHGIKIPRRDKEQMLKFLQDGPEEGHPPEWVYWAAGVCITSPALDVASDDDDESDSFSSSDTDKEEYLPFLHLPKNPNGLRCRCGSDTHLTTNSHACKLNPRNLVGSDVDVDVAEHDDAVPDAVASPQRRSRTRDDIEDAPPRRRRCRNYLRPNAEVEVLYEDHWWPAKIKFKHRGDNGYAIKYHDEEECEEPNVPAERIRSPQD